MTSENLYIYGDAIKASADGKIKGYAIRFGSPDNTDLEADYFVASTDYGRPMKMGDKFKINLYYHHGADSTMKSYPIGYGEVMMDDVGLWYEAQIDMSNEYGKMIDKLAQQGKLGFSSGAAGHLVTREKTGKSYKIMSWPIAEVSVTPTPAESRNKVYKLIDMKIEEYDMKESESEDVEDMVEGLVEMGVSPQDLAMSIFSEADAELAIDSVNKLYYMMCGGFDAVIEGGYNVDYAYILIDEFANRAKDAVGKLYNNPMDEMASIKILTKGPETQRELEKALRDVLHFSNSQSKALAGKMADFFRDQEVAAKQTEEHIANDSEVKNLLIKKMMLDLMRD
jgi:phage head maturation protease